jgi:hypothetical protein
MIARTGVVCSIVDLGVGFEGPNGTGRGNNPSDNSLAVGPNHIMQTVNGRGIAIFTKQGKVLFGPVPANNVFTNFGGNCEARNSGDVWRTTHQLRTAAGGRAPARLAGRQDHVATVYRRIGNRESILATHSIGTAAGGGGVRWYEFRVNQKSRSVSLYQQGTYLGDGDYRWMASGSTLRWQDYTTTALDPIDDCTVWYVGDYFKKDATSYSTRIGAFRMPGCK